MSRKVPAPTPVKSVLFFLPGALYPRPEAESLQAKFPFPVYPSYSQNTPIMASILSLFPLLILHTLLLAPTKTYSQNDPILTYCAGDTNYTVPSTFSSNLDLLLSNLTSSPSDAGYFATATAGAASSAPAYGLAQCRPDASAFNCSTCLNRSASAGATRCPHRKSAAIRFDLCILRYSDQRFFGQLEDEPTEMLFNGANASDPTVFDREMRDLMDEIASQAAGRESKFGVGITNNTDSGDIYGMAQCTRDLSETDCSTCLDQAVGLLPTGSIGGQVVKVSCAVRFEIYPFFSLSLVPPPPPPPPPPPQGSSSSLGGGNGADTTGDGKSNNATKVVLIVAISVVAVLVVLFAICLCLRRRKVFRREQFEIALSVTDGDEEGFRSSESLLFDLGALRAATNNFSNANKLGEGGFGPVYKGTLRDGREIAVKRLSGSSVQGLVELRNELVLVAKLQHRNLVKLLGCCLEEQERLLVYEYLPNTSLDKFLFDPIGRQQLDWGSRYKIIEGMGRGLLYLHVDSRLRIIHRDLKPGNILLDGDMNPKISDFGLAKLFSRDETHGNTSRIAGTYGYMAPEYAMHGHFSTKSDVFSYGVLVLEIVTGRRNSGFQGSGNSIDLLGYVWQHWNEGMATQVIDRSLGNQYQAREVLRCIQIGLLCVQEEPGERPSMASVILMLSSYSVTVSPPSPPAFFVSGGTVTESEVFERNVRTSLSGGESSGGSTTRESRRRTGKSKLVSLNDVSITEMEPR